MPSPTVHFLQQFFLTGAIVAACTAASLWVCTAASLWVCIEASHADYWQADAAFGIIIGGCVAWMVQGGVMKNRPNWWPTERLRRWSEDGEDAQ